MTRSCKNCELWDIARKVNCSNPDTPIYYAECLFPVDDLPWSATMDRTSENDGDYCPQWKQRIEK